LGLAPIPSIIEHIEQLPLKKQQMWRISARNPPHLRDLADLSPATTNRVVEQVH
jgi:hypothetical protein